MVQITGKWDYQWHISVSQKVVLAIGKLSEFKSSEFSQINKIWSKTELFDEFERNHVYKRLFTFVLKNEKFKIRVFLVKQYRLRNSFENHAKISTLCLLSARSMGRFESLGPVSGYESKRVISGSLKIDLPHHKVKNRKLSCMDVCKSRIIVGGVRFPSKWIKYLDKIFG